MLSRIPRTRYPTPVHLRFHGLMPLLFGGIQILAAETRWCLREPLLRHFTPLPTTASGQRIAARESTSGQPVEFGSRFLLRTFPPHRPSEWRASHAWTLERTLNDQTAVFNAASALDALTDATALAEDPRVEIVSVSRRRFNASLQGGWAPAPNDPYFDRQWYLDPSQGITGPGPAASSGVHFRSAWAESRGQSITIAIVDNGSDATHPDLRDGFVPELARNWFTHATNCAHTSQSQFHGTAIAGLAAARGGNGIGMSGAAPGARWTGWVVFDSAGNLPETQDLADAIGFETDRVPVQNHSWANADLDFLYSTPVEQIALSNALHHARGGLGTVLVRAAGNTRTKSAFGARGVGDANLDAFANDPGAVTVAGLRRDGTVASYSTPGACVLVAMPGGEVSEGSQLFTLDPVGNAGANSIAAAGPELANYLYGTKASVGTSFATPLVSGLVALSLDRQPHLANEDLQRLLAIASHPLDPADPDRATNAAGFVISHNVGFGTPDAASLLRLVQLPRFNTPSPARASLRVSASGTLPIPDDGLRVEITGIPQHLSFPASGGAGLHPDNGLPDSPITDGLDGSKPVPAIGSVQLLQRGTFEPPDLIRFAAQNGAVLAVIGQNEGDNSRSLMLGTDTAPIPAVCVGRTDAQSIRAAALHPQARIRVTLQSAVLRFPVSETLSLDSVQVRLRCSHPRMGDLRVVLRSPSGTSSVLQRCGTQSTPQIADWTYSSKRHLFEPSAGIWTLTVTDEAPGMSGSIQDATLVLRGMPIADVDSDGLDDAWERSHFQSLTQTGLDDPDADGWPHAVEAWLGTDPLVSDRPFVARIFPTDTHRFRIEWPSRPDRSYRLERAASATGPWSPLGSARFPGITGNWCVPDSGSDLFRIVEE